MLGRWQAVAQAADIADPHPNEVKDAVRTGAARWRRSTVLMQGGPKDGITKARHWRVAGWRPDKGREGRNPESGNISCQAYCGLSTQRTLLQPTGRLLATVRHHRATGSTVANPHWLAPNFPASIDKQAYPGLPFEHEHRPQTICFLKSPDSNN